MKRFLKKLFLHPGTWILGALTAVGIAMAAPAAAAALVIIAAVGVAAAAIAIFPWIVENVKAFLGRNTEKSGKLNKDGKVGLDWMKAHPAQAIAIAVTVGLIITALVLTIGFFTGGAGFLFMAPVFAALAVPFTASTLGVSLFVPAITGFCFVIAAFNFGNTVDRFLSWLDSFKYDGAMAYSKKERSDQAQPQQGQLEQNVPMIGWDENATLTQKQRETAVKIAEEKYNYFPTVFKGISEVVSNGFSSKYEAKLEEAEKYEAKLEEANPSYSRIA